MTVEYPPGSHPLPSLEEASSVTVSLAFDPDEGGRRHFSAHVGLPPEAGTEANAHALIDQTIRYLRLSWATHGRAFEFMEDSSNTIQRVLTVNATGGDA